MKNVFIGLLILCYINNVEAKNPREYCWHELNGDFVCLDMSTGKKTTVSRRI